MLQIYSESMFVATRVDARREQSAGRTAVNRPTASSRPGNNGLLRRFLGVVS